jgi:carbamoyltransferase
MKILSFTFWPGSHDSSAAIVCDGELLAAAEEERFSRHKHDGAVPVRAIDYCLREAGLEMKDVDLVAYPSQPFRSGRDSQLADADLSLVKRLQAEGALRARALAHKCVLDVLSRLKLPLKFNWSMESSVRAGFQDLRRRYGALPPVRYYDHHRAHAATVYLTSGWDEAAVATVDGRGGLHSAATWAAKGTTLKRVKAEPYTNSLGYFYLHSTRYLGMGEFGEGKTMGLAPYGDRTVLADRVATLLDTQNCNWYRYRQRPSPEALGFPRRKQQPVLEGPYAHYAAACQAALEVAFTRVATSAIHDVGSGNLCLGGGVSLNCSANGLMLSSGIASSIWVFPAAGDGGLSVGAALLTSAEEGEFRRRRLPHAYWGPEFGVDACEKALRAASGVTYARRADVVSEAASRLAAGQVLGWFQGRMELGPRALGNRSILADPRSAKTRDRVNQIKGREPWRPLAPAVLAECARDFFELETESPFMLFAVPVRPGMRALVPAIVHVDGTARPQTVTPQQNQRLHAVISCFREKTGIPLLLNTSFNAAGEPIVCTPEDALRTFAATGLDALILGDFVVTRANVG